MQSKDGDTHFFCMSSFFVLFAHFFYRFIYLYVCTQIERLNNYDNGCFVGQKEEGVVRDEEGQRVKMVGSC